MHEIIRDIKVKFEQWRVRVQEQEKLIKGYKHGIHTAQETIDELKRHMEQAENAITALEKL